MKEFIALATKTYTYVIDDVHVEKQAQDAKKCAIKEEIKF